MSTPGMVQHSYEGIKHLSKLGGTVIVDLNLISPLWPASTETYNIEGMVSSSRCTSYIDDLFVDFPYTAAQSK